jgi:hypothetical protein
MATSFTSGPWSSLHQHGGPPIALLGTAIERVMEARGGGFFLASLQCEFLRPVPVDALIVNVNEGRKGKTVRSLTATLSNEETPLLRATALFLAETDGLPEVTHALPLPPRPDASAIVRFPFRWGPTSYQDAIDLRLARGEVGSGSAAAWLEPRFPLVLGEETSPLGSPLIVADAANGVSAPLSTAEFDFINPNLVLSLWRKPKSAPYLIESDTRVSSHGVGLVDARLSDSTGFIGRLSQSLLIRPHVPT